QLQPFQVAEILDLSDRDVFTGSHFVAHEILKNDSDFSVQILEIVFAEVHAIEEHLPFFRVVKASHQLNQRGLAFSVFPDKGNTRARAEVKIKVSEDQT